MPINRIKKTVKKAAAQVRSRWTTNEAQRRHDMADVMQMQLLTALGFQPAPVRK